jgi:peptidoglycan glycosyltransferase
VNKPIGRLFVVSLLMFAALLVSTSWWTVLRADSLNNDHPDLNRRSLLRSLKIKRGTIRASDGTALARSVRGREGVYRRTYPPGSLFGHPVGYSYVTIGQTGVEAFYDDDLMGQKDALTTTFDQLLGRKPEGDNLITTLDPKAQRIAEDGILRAGQSGAAVALDPRTGAIKVMASVPSFDPNVIRDPKALAAANRDEQRKPLVNRALQFGYAPGSTFKVVTATAAIDSGQFQPGSAIDGTNDVKISGVPLSNDFNQSFGQIDLTTALAKSVNTAWAQVGEKLGKRTMAEYMRRFGFERKPQLDYPKNAMSASGEYRNGHLIPATSPFVDVGRMAIGQDKLSVVPLQMAEVAAAVANGGRLMKPHIVSRVVDNDGRTTRRILPKVQSDVMKPSTAAAVRDMMIAVVERGTGTQAKIPGTTVAGKTGTAETQIGTKINDVWFIAFAPAEAPRVAVAVTVAQAPGFGGDIAAPIARDIMEELLR